MGRTQKEDGMMCVTVLSQHSLEETEETYKRAHVGYLAYS
jgi:hypothetical protein